MTENTANLSADLIESLECDTSWHSVEQSSVDIETGKINEEPSEENEFVSNGQQLIIYNGLQTKVQSEIMICFMCLLVISLIESKRKKL